MRLIAVASALVANASCIYVAGISEYEKGACEGACADAATEVASETGAGCPSDMVLVAAGSYVPIAKPGGGIVSIGALCVDRTEVTESAYRACVASGACTAPLPKTFCNYGIPGRENDAINCVDLTHSKAFCASLGKRLPTEDEWEWVARGGRLGYAFPWGNVEPAAADSPERLCWQGKARHDDGAIWPNRPAGTCATGSFSAGARDGIFDLAGNVWEWTSTEAEGNTFVFRGGSAFDDPKPENFRAGSRRTGASAQFSGVGVRCFRDATP